MGYKYKENKKKSGRPRNKDQKFILPAISVDLELKQAMDSALAKLNKSSTDFRRMAYRMLVQYVDKKL